jgi:hypothetical protein
MSKISFKDKSTEDILLEMENLAGGSLNYPVFDAMSAAIQVGVVNKLCNTIDTASENFLLQISHLNERIEGARNNFVTESDAFRKSMAEIKASLEEFRESNEKASRTLTRATYVLAFVALVQAVILAYPLLR